MTNQNMPKKVSAPVAEQQQHPNKRAAAENNEEEKHILASRYKTKLCKNYVAKGECPYEVRCMFAHGEEEMRTTEDNVRDGLVTEEAIKSFQRQQHQGKYRSGYSGARQSHNVGNGHSANVHATSNHRPYEMEKAEEANELYLSSDSLCLSPPQCDPAMLSFSQSALPLRPHMQYGHHMLQLRNSVTKHYSHNPYAYDLIPIGARIFPVHCHNVVEESRRFDEKETIIAVQDECYFPSSDMMMPLVPSSVTQQPNLYVQYGKPMETVGSASSYGYDEALYGQKESSNGYVYRSIAHCKTADLPSNSDIVAMVMEP